MTEQSTAFWAIAMDGVSEAGMISSPLAFPVLTPGTIPYELKPRPEE